MARRTRNLTNSSFNPQNSFTPTYTSADRSKQDKNKSQSNKSQSDNQSSNFSDNWNVNFFEDVGNYNVSSDGNFVDTSPSSASKKSGQIRFSHILVFVLLGILIASNLVASRVAGGAITWFLLAFGFLAFLVLAAFILRILYRLGYKILSAFLFLPIFVAGVFFGANVAAVINDSLINESLLSELPAEPQYIFYIRGKNNQMVQAFDESERFVSPSEMWENWFSRAAIAIEDERFETRYEGVIDAKAVARAALKNLWQWNTTEGASGIEIQTAKLLTGHYKTKSYLQKAGQGLIALRLDQRFPFPEEKFCLYGNIVDLVSGKRGVGAAASDLFGVSDLKLLSISQSAVLAAMLKNSGIWNPRTNPKAVKERRDIVLKKMLDLEFISEEQYKTALNEEIKLVPRIKPNEIFIRAAVNFHKLGKEKTQ